MTFTLCIRLLHPWCLLKDQYSTCIYVQKNTMALYCIGKLYIFGVYLIKIELTIHTQHVYRHHVHQGCATHVEMGKSSLFICMSYDTTFSHFHEHRVRHEWDDKAGDWSGHTNCMAACCIVGSPEAKTPFVATVAFVYMEELLLRTSRVVALKLDCFVVSHYVMNE